MEPAEIKKKKIEDEGNDKFIILQYNNSEWQIDKEIIQKVPYLQKLTENPSSNQYYILPENGDCNFNELGLNIFFGILEGETTKDHKTSEDLISFLAVSSLFQYHELCQCSETMIIESINETNVIDLFFASEKYPTNKASKWIFDWLLVNFMTRFSDTNTFDSELVKVDHDLMMRLLKNHSFVVSNEYKLYTLLKKWMLVDLKKKNQQHHYENIDTQEYFLDTVAGQQYKPFFDLIRLKNLIDYTDKVELIRRDKIFANKQINAAAFKILQIILELKDQSCLSSIPDFETNCYRSSNVLTKKLSIFKTDYFNNGVSMRFDITSNKFSVERLPPENSKHKLFCHNIIVNIRIRLSLYSLTSSQSSEKTSIIEISLPKTNHTSSDIYMWCKQIDYPCILFMEIQTIFIENPF